jgi:hypothetical protein
MRETMLAENRLQLVMNAGRFLTVASTIAILLYYLPNYYLYEKIIAENSDAAVLALVGHGGPNRLILCQALGISLTRLWRLGQDFGSLSIIDDHGSSALISLLNFRQEILGR